MIYNIENKKINAIIKDEWIDLPKDLKEKIKINFEYIQKTGAKVWNGEIFGVIENNIYDDHVNIVCKKTNFAHYLYSEKIKCTEKYICHNLSAGCLIETKDNCYLFGEQEFNPLFPNMLTLSGGNIDKKDINSNKIDLMATIVRETLEEINIDLNNKDIVLYNKIKYIHIPENDEQPGVIVFSKVKINMTSKELEKHFEKYYKYLNENNLEIEFGKVYFIKKEESVEKLKEMNNPKGDWLFSLIRADINNY